MRIIPQIETPASESYASFEESLIKIINGMKKSGLSGLSGSEGLPSVVLEQNFGINALILCKDLKDRYKDLNTAYAFNMRDKNRISIISDLMTLKRIGVKDIIVSEGLHPLKTMFKAAKPVYDIDVFGLALILKRDFMNGLYGSDGFDSFNLGVVIGASALADGLKAKKLIKTGADRLIVSYNGENPDVNMINYIKSENKEVFLYIKEPDIKYPLDDFIKSNEDLNIDGIIVKIASEKSNIFTQYFEKNGI